RAFNSNSASNVAVTATFADEGKHCNAVFDQHLQVSNVRAADASYAKCLQRNLLPMHNAEMPSAVLDRQQIVFGLAVLASCAVGCSPGLAPCSEQVLRPGDIVECSVPGWTDRAFTLHLPTAAQTLNGPRGVVIGFHGGAGNRQSTNTSTCPAGDENSPGCLAALANARGYAVVFPDGTGARPARNLRTWNAGGGQLVGCVSGAACRSNVNDAQYFDDLLEQLRSSKLIDVDHVFLTGISNGAAITHRLACERNQAIRAIAAVAGTNQYFADGGTCAAPMAVLQIHGTEDPCWPFDGGSQSCLEDVGKKIGVAESMDGWWPRNGCTSMSSTTVLNDLDPTDGTTVALQRWQGCRKATESLIIQGGGHTWPNGNPYASEDRVGRVTRDVGSEQILQFFEDNRE
nr:hypothetical protein [Kofleriaceae bacterium]